jgi:hypothetical protein
MYLFCSAPIWIAMGIELSGNHTGCRNYADTLLHTPHDHLSYCLWKNTKLKLLFLICAHEMNNQ